MTSKGTNPLSRRWIASLMSASALAGAATMAAPAWAADDAAAKQCAGLMSLSSGNMKVTKASYVTEPMTAVQAQQTAVGAVAAAGARAGGEATAVSFCRVEVTTTPAAGAEIKTEVWMPEKAKWNGK